MDSRFVFPVQDLLPRGLDVASPLPFEWLAALLGDTEIRPAPEADNQVQVRLSMSGRDVVVRGKVKASILGQCGRCLEAARIDIATELSLLLSPTTTGGTPSARNRRQATAEPKKGRGGRNADDGQEFTGEKADTDTYDGEQVVLDPFLREAILLEVPIFPLCSEQCPGIGPIPSQPGDPSSETDSIDPRLRPLLALQNKSRS